MFFNSKGEEKFFKLGDNTNGLPDKLSLKDFAGIDRIAGWGEQIYSFDAAFSKRGGNGEPVHLFDWNTGAVNPEVAALWESHDINKIVSKFSRQKCKLLNGKIHVYVADNDPFGLNLPVKSFLKTLTEKGIDADIKLLTEGGHIIWTDEIRKTIHDDMDAKIKSAGN